MQARCAFEASFGGLHRHVEDCARIALLADAGHVNAGGRIVHGGLLMSFAAMACEHIVAARTECVDAERLDLKMDFSASVKSGDFVEVTCESFTSIGGRAHLLGHLRTAETVVATVSSSWLVAAPRERRVSA